MKQRGSVVVDGAIRDVISGGTPGDQDGGRDGIPGLLLRLSALEWIPLAPVGAGDRRRRWLTRGRLGLGCSVLACIALSWAGEPCSSAAGPEPVVAAHRDGFDIEQPSWRISAERPDAAQLRVHERTSKSVHGGNFAEHIQIDAQLRGERIYIEQPTPRALVFDELTAKVWVRSNRPGVRVGVRIMFPRQIDPRTGQALTADLLGDTYKAAHRWEQLTCRTRDQDVRQLVGRLRGQLARALGTPEIAVQGMYVDRVLLFQETEVGSNEYLIDDLELTPLVDPESNGAGVVQASWEPELTAPVTLGDGRLLREGRPFFPIIMPYHGEELDLLRKTGVNVAWIPKYDDRPLLEALASAGLGAMAEPPAQLVRPASDAQAGLSYEAGLPLFAEESSNVLFWHLGSELKPETLPSVRAAAEAVRDADRSRRPVMVDVTGSGREFHRVVDVMGFSKHSIHTSTSPLDYVRFLELGQLQALRGKPVVTWIFTEANRANVENRSADAAVPVVEPEQIWMQVWAALGSGVKGLGYWKHGRLGAGDRPGDVERANAILLANLQIHLLRHWLAAGQLVDVAPVRMGTSLAPTQKRASETLLSKFNFQGGRVQTPDPIADQVRAPVIKTPYGWLILPHWLDPDGQYQPGQMHAQDVRILLRGVTADHAWEVTTTGVHPYQVRIDPTAAGGSEISLQRIDQCSAIIVTSDPAIADEMAREAAAWREVAGRAWVELTQAKLERVQAVHDALQGLTRKPVNDGDYILAEARRELRNASLQLEAGQFDDARQTSQKVLRMTRLVQRAHWENAARMFSSPVATPYSICFQTLPDFWKFMESVDRQSSGQNVLKGGQFEDWGSLLPVWDFQPGAPDETVSLAVELAPDGLKGRCLRLAALPANPREPPTALNRSPVRVVAPPIPVFSGQIVRVTGQVRIQSPPSAHPDGLMVYDNLAGTVGALRWRADAPTGRWVPFELLRPVQRSGDFQLTIELCGLGDVRFDELEVRTLSPP